MEARKFTQILVVLVVSFGCYIHGTTVVFPAVFLPSYLKSNGTWDSVEGNGSSVSNVSFFERPLPFYVDKQDEALIGKKFYNLWIAKCCAIHSNCKGPSTHDEEFADEILLNEEFVIFI